MKPALNGGEVADLDELFNDHDKNPKAAAEALRAMASEGLVAEQDHRRFAGLVSHVIGEKEGDWSAAFDILDKTVADSLEVPCMVHRAVAALGAGKPLKAFSLMADIAEQSECSYAAADATVKLLVLQFSCADEPVPTLVAVFNGVLSMLDGTREQLGKLSGMAAASLNNVTSRLMDARNVDIHLPAYRHALTAGAQTCRSVWQLAGNWMNHERADYLVALCANRLRDYEAAKTAACAGLKTIDDNGIEDVDRAFLLLELARAHRGLGQAEESHAARAEALKLADGFDNDLRVWFDARAAA